MQNLRGCLRVSARGAVIFYINSGVKLYDDGCSILTLHHQVYLFHVNVLSAVSVFRNMQKKSVVAKFHILFLSPKLKDRDYLHVNTATWYCMECTPVAPFTLTWFDFITAWISNYMPGKVCGEITYSFLNFQRLHRWSLGMDK